MLARFSTVAGELGAADHERDVRGFALKFYTGEGNWDLVGNNTPVFFVRDPYKFPDFIHTQKRHPKTNMRSPTAMWDFWSLSPESLHQVTILFSDRGIPQSPRFMHGFGSHTFSFINAAGERHWVKFHFKTQQGIEFHTNREAEGIVGRTRESYQADLFGAIEERRLPQVDDVRAGHAGGRRRQALVQPVRPDEGVAARRLSAHRGRRHGAQPQPGQLLPGDRAGRLLALQRRPRHRLFARQDAAGARLLLCGRAPLPPRHALRDAAREPSASARWRTITRTARCASSRRRRAPTDAYYEPTRSAAPRRTSASPSRRWQISGDADRYNHRDGNDDYKQAGDLFRLMPADAQARLMDNIVEAMGGVPAEIVERQIAHFYKADPAYGRGVAQRTGLNITAEAAE